MKKRIGTLIVTMCFVVLGLMGMTAQADAATTQHGLADYMYTTDGAESINISLHKYNRFQSKEDQSYLLKNYNGGYTRLEFIKQGVDIYDEYGLFIEEYDKSFNLKSTKEVKMPYPIFGGVCFGKEYNFLFSSQINTWEKDDFPVMYIQIFDKEWTKEIERLEITNNTLGAKDPMDKIYTAFGVASNLQMAEIGDNYYFHFGYEMCQLPEEYGYNIFHQRNATYVLKNTDDGWTFEMFPQLLVSHSWNQFITTDGEYLYLLDQQDGDPEREEQKAAIFYQKIAKDSTNKTGIKSFKTDLKQTYEAYQFTGTSLGSFKLIDNMFFTAGNSEEYYDRPADLRDSHFNQRNIFVDLIDKNFTKDTYSRNWITEYPVVYEDDENYIDVGNPYIVTTDTEYSYVIWSEYIKKTDTNRLGIAKINKKGERVGNIHYIYGHLSDADPLYVDGKLIWYVTGYHEGNLDYPTKPVFYSINIVDLEAGKYEYTESYKMNDLNIELESYEMPFDHRSHNDEAKIKSINMEGDDYQLVEGVDYLLTYENLDKATNDAKVVLQGIGMFRGERKITYSIVRTNLSKPEFQLVLDPSTVTFDPTEPSKNPNNQKPNWYLTYNGEKFDVPMSPQFTFYGQSGYKWAAGTYTYTLEVKNATGYDNSKATAIYTIEPLDMNKAENVSIKLNQDTFTYDGKAKTPTVTVYKDGNSVPQTQTLYSSVTGNKTYTNYTVSYENNVNAGTATVIVKFQDNYKGTLRTEFTITRTGSGSGTESEAHSTCTWDEGTITKEATCTSYAVRTYKCTYPGCTKTKTASEGTKLSHQYVVFKSVISQASDKLTGSVKMGCSACSSAKTVLVPKIDINSVKLEKTEYTYTGSAIKPVTTVKDIDGNVLIAGTDYTVSYKNNVNAGTATATINFKDKYKGSVTKTFTIKGVEKSSQTISVAGSTKTIKITKTYGNAAFNLNAKAKTDLTYKTSSSKVATVSNLGRVSIKGTGRATITITAASTDKYKSATKKITIDVKPKKVSSLKLKAAKKKMTVSWKKDSKASGYRIAYTTDKKFKKGIKYTTTTSTKKTISKLKSKKYYYVKVQAYKKVGSTKLYGSYTSAKKVKIK